MWTPDCGRTVDGDAHRRREPRISWITRWTTLRHVAYIRSCPEGR